MSHEIVTHLPAALRKHAVRDLECETDGQYDLMNACKSLDMGKSNCSTTVPLTNDALGALLDICRDWKANSKNGNEVMAGKSVLTRHELDYQPEDPRERRHEVKMPKSLGSYVNSQIRQGSLKNSPEVRAELDACMNGDTSLSGRVTYATLGWLLNIAKSNSIHGAGAEQRAGRKFLDTYTEAYEQTGRLVNGYLGTDDEDGQALAEVGAIEDQDQEPAEEATAEQAGKSVGPIPENFVFMAENADTKTARAWWARKVASWGR
ncbi:hypothetical protein OG401_14420 [Kitasatospora purpeofusca]|uniref:hypothetical protein n=1 Tax=Kitasatospora purpeofusca TaxID=67352 RepID=UPI002257ECA9|nr:hypothetical protein [Kitasatospora purpeofusca]MCX4685494.1 hypothetical protein [Kitasatospora purpeofusca]